jgi:hypothetical protein
VKSLAESLEGLAALLEQENEALRLHDFSRVPHLAEQKRQAISGLSEVCSDHANEPPLVLEASFQAKLRERLDAALAENKRLLEASVKIQAEVIAIVLRAVEAPLSPRYRINGTQQSCMTPPVALAMRA